MERTKKTESVKPLKPKEILVEEGLKGIVEVVAEVPTPEVKVFVSLEPVKLKWRKLGGGGLRLKDKRIIKPNQVFMATIDEIPKAFMDTLESLENEPLDVILNRAAVLSTEKEVVYKIVEQEEETSAFDVVNIETGKAINEVALTKEQAVELKTALEA